MARNKLALAVLALSLSACSDFSKGVNEGYYAAEDGDYAEATKKF